MKKLDVLWVDREPGQLPTGFAVRGNMTQADLEQLMQEDKMTQEEWLSHSEEWRRGYNAWAHDEQIDPFEPRDPEWLDGYRYAIRTVGAGPQ